MRHLFSPPFLLFFPIYFHPVFHFSFPIYLSIFYPCNSCFVFILFFFLSSISLFFHPSRSLVSFVLLYSFYRFLLFIFFLSLILICSCFSFPFLFLINPFHTFCRPLCLFSPLFSSPFFPCLCFIQTSMLQFFQNLFISLFSF